ncbi:hypothetical protein [Pseudomonas trivialis]|uniref:hypothetical protein n=1 Tax=Pseudomonas trivialis TaxID=200450 RepID=UPI001910444C
MFNANQHGGDHYLKLSHPNGSRREKLNLQFHPINYTKGLEQIPFFQSLGRLTSSTLKSSWYGFEGEFSNCAEDIFSNQEEWRNTYWNNFYRDITKKSDDWRYENEHRLILSSSFNDYTNPAERSLKYDFSSLDGIIFDIKTSMTDKLEIIKIIEKNVQKKKDQILSFIRPITPRAAN